jgi:cytochrome P450/NADPH-cytochrome P450 reductase
MSSLSTRSSSSSSGARAEPDHHKHIPQPKETLLLGNLPDIDPTLSLLSLVRLAVIHGPIYQLKVPGNLIVIVSSQELVHEVCDEKRFEKLLSAPLVQVRNFAGDGLFTAYNDEVLVPAFGPLAIKKMQSGMMDIITQMLMSWEHYAGEPFEAADQFTRLTFVSVV